MLRLIILVSIFLTGCSSYKVAMVELPTGMPDAIGPAKIYTIGVDSEIDKNSYYSDIKSNNLPDFLDYHWKVIDQSLIVDSEDIQSFIDHINDGFGDPKAFMMCFEPRHAITYQSNFGSVTALICFECGQVSISIENWHTDKYFVTWPIDDINSIYKKYDVRVPLPVMP